MSEDKDRVACLKKKRSILRTAVTNTVTKLEHELLETERIDVDKWNSISTVDGFSIYDSTYDAAINLLKERFAREDLLIQTHMSNILNIKPLKHSNDINAFRKFYDKVSMELRSLECLGLCIENISSVLCTTILRALPRDILIEFNQLQNEKSYTNVNDLLNFLSLSLRSRERAALRSCDSSSRRFTTFYPSNNSSFETQRDFENHKSDKTKQFSACQLISTDIE
ncbi:DUF1758 domain-containing protein [Trichonephila clavata]|uniref:DUF1758 domain-containing protein n=1 Tax=Trichonephila clavata TaxID=2740835 RepID=A0A8X6K6C8_TRICU|nr:DUF1758 domain-containing protein [Trichonephila clavata]